MFTNLQRNADQTSNPARQLEAIRSAVRLSGSSLIDLPPAFRELLDLLPIAVYCCAAPDGVICWYNRRCADLWGRSPATYQNTERFCGSYRIYSIDGVYLPHTETPAALILANGEPVRNQEVIVERPDGSRKTVLVNLEAIHNEDGTIAGFINVLQDITERKKISQALESSEERFRAAFNLAAVGMVQTEAPSGRFIAVNDKMCEITGYEREELLHLSPCDLYYADDYEEAASHYNRMLAGEIGSFTCQKRYVRKDQAVIWVNTTVTLVRSKDGCPSYTLGVIEDVTAQREAADALLRSEQRFRAITESVPQLVWEADPHGATIYRNALTLEYLGAEYRETGWTWLKSLHPEDAGRTLAAWSTAVSQGTSYEIEHRMRGADGEFRWFLSRGVPIRDSRGNVSTWYGTSTDIEEQKRSEAMLRTSDAEQREIAAALRRSNEALNRANADLRQFAYAAAHDLREPLRNIALYSQLLTRQHVGDLSERAAAALTYINEGAQRMDSLVGDLLSYAQAVSDDSVPTPASIRTAFDTAVQNLEQSILAAEPSVTLDLLVSEVAARSAHLSQLLQNLIGNAIKYRNPERTVVIQVAAERVGSEVVFRISDNGIGIEPEYTARIFGVFKRLHGRDVPGTGIGLAICKRIVEHYGGRIWVDSTPGAGSTFFFTLPAP